MSVTVAHAMMHTMVLVMVMPSTRIVMLPVFFRLPCRARFSKYSLVRLITRLEGLGGMDKSVELNVGKALGFFGHPVLDNVDILHASILLEFGF